MEFDPTNSIVGNQGLIRVAAARDLHQAAPIPGAWSGVPGRLLDMAVGMDVEVDPPDAPAATLPVAGWRIARC